MGAPDPLGTASHPLILFDGVCNLCNAAVQFIIKRDKKEKFKFASLQSPGVHEYLSQLSAQGPELSTMVLVKNNKLYDRSTAALEIARDLSGFWPTLYSLMVFPKFLRDAVYNFIARNRYRFFGKKDECMIPSPELK